MSETEQKVGLDFSRNAFAFPSPSDEAPAYYNPLIDWITVSAIEKEPGDETASYLNDRA